MHNRGFLENKKIWKEKDLKTKRFETQTKQQETKKVPVRAANWVRLQCRVQSSSFAQKTTFRENAK
jgi:hypothetical protein